jgi:protein tyrosine/serine phosphatase
LSPARYFAKLAVTGRRNRRDRDFRRTRARAALDIGDVEHVLAKYTKPYSKAIALGYRKARRAADRRSPNWLLKVVGPALEYFDLYLVDYGVFRALYSNSHKVAEGVWRSSQPAPHQIRRFARRGVRTVVNLRGERDCGSYRLEFDACKRHGISLIDFPMFGSRAAPEKAALAQIKDLFDQMEYPVLLHCKSGADRAGIVSSLYLFFKEGRPIEEAVRHLSLRYGHVKQADTGVLDYFFERYMEHNRKTPTPFWEWVDAVYDPVELKRSFRARSWANMLVNRIAVRE